MKRTLKFFRPDYGETIEDAYEHTFKTAFPDDIQFLAQEYAEFYHNNRDGWEAHWPMVFVVADENDSILGTYEVERDSMPVFSARLKNDQQK